MSLVYDPDFLDDRVYEGLWTRHYGPRHSSRVLTLSTYRALFVFAILLIVVEYASGRLWIILRYFIYHALRKRGGLPIHLSGESRLCRSNGDELDTSIDTGRAEAGRAATYLELSRTRAIFNTFYSIEAGTHWLLHSVGRSSPASSKSYSLYDPGLSACFGIGALFCVVGFLSLSAAAPYVLADGIFDAPIVKTRAMQDCIQSSEDRLSHGRHFLKSIYAPEKTDSLFRMCHYSRNGDCFNENHLKTPKVERKWLSECPFRQDACVRRSRPLEMTHWNITAFELGINSPSRWSLNHRTTCVPLAIDEFLLHSTISNSTWVSARNSMDGQVGGDIQALDGFALQLQTLNGPNHFSNTSSGPEYRRMSGKSDITILPDAYATIIGVNSNDQPWNNIHQYLYRKDAKSYMIVQRGGDVMFDRPVDDPFFSAHQHVMFSDAVDGEPMEKYLPDQEATGIGCMDQFQICIADSEMNRRACSTWHAHGNIVRELLYIQSEDDELTDLWGIKMEVMIDAFTYLATAVPSLSMYKALAMRKVLSPASRLLKDPLNTVSSSGTGGVKDPWANEVETWFMKAIIDTIVQLRASAHYSTANFDSDLGVAMRRAFGEGIRHDWTACDKILVRNNGYTNINWYGLCSTLGALVCICLISFFIESEMSLRMVAKRSMYGFRLLMSHWKVHIHRIRDMRAFGAVLSVVKIPALLNSLPIIRNVSRSWRTWQYAARPPRTSAGAPGPTASASTTPPDVNGSSDAIGLEDLGEAEEIDDPI